MSHRALRVERLETRRLLASTTLVDHGPGENRVDIVVLGDGYRDAELPTTYAGHVAAVVAEMFDGGEEPFATYRRYFNVHRIDIVSAESGADRPWQGVFRDTALDAAYDCDGLRRTLCVDPSKARQVLTDEAVPLGIHADIQLVAVNDNEYGGSGSSFAVFAAGHAEAGQLALHELGHSFSQLADEYGGGGSYTGSEPREVNVTKSNAGEKWQAWLGYQQSGLSPVGAYPGGHLFDTGIYRPTQDSKMRTLGKPFDAIAREQIVLDIYDRVRPLDQWTDNARRIVSANPQFQVTRVDDDRIQLQWFVNGQPVPGAIGPDFSLVDHVPDDGTYTVGVRAIDPTDWVRRNRDRLQQDVSWNVVLVRQPALWVDLHQDAVSENQGPQAATATVRRLNVDLDQPLVVAMATSDDSELLAPVAVTIPAGQAGIVVTLDAVDDDLLDGPQTVTVTAESAGYVTVPDQLRVDDYEDFAIQFDHPQIEESAGKSSVRGTITRSNLDREQAVDVILTVDPSDWVQFSYVEGTPGGIPGKGTNARGLQLAAGQASADFLLDIIDNAEIDGDRMAAVRAVATAYAPSTAPLQLLDDEVVWVTLDATQIPEDAGAGAVVANVRRSRTSIDSAVSVVLTSDRPGQLVAPPSVTVPAGQRSIHVPLDVVDDQWLNGSRSVRVSASADGHAATESTVVLTDVERLSITLPAQLAENDGLVPNLARVRRENLDLDQPLTVHLTSSQTAELQVPASVVIPAGLSEVFLPLQVMDDVALDGTQQVQVSVSAEGYIGALQAIEILDIETWQNPFNRLDVSGDDIVTARDALLVINDLNSLGARRLPSDMTQREYFLDTTGDDFVSPLDVLLVVNFLNRAGEGESSPIHQLPDLRFWWALETAAWDDLNRRTGFRRAIERSA